MDKIMQIDFDYTRALIKKALSDISLTGKTDTLSYHTLCLDNQLSGDYPSDDWTNSIERSQWGFQLNSEFEADCLMQFCIHKNLNAQKMNQLCKELGFREYKIQEAEYEDLLL